METTVKERKITQQEFQNLLDKMTFYNMQEGYIGEVRGKIELFVAPCDKATALITLEQVVEALDKYKNGKL
jgi:hypothetical protein